MCCSLLVVASGRWKRATVRCVSRRTLARSCPSLGLCNGWPGVVLVLQALRPQILGANAYAESDTIIKVPKEEEVRGRRSSFVWRSCAGAPVMLFNQRAAVAMVLLLLVLLLVLPLSLLS